MDRIRQAQSFANEYHGKIPVLRALPLRVIGVIFAVAFVNMLCWAGVGVVLNKHKALMGTSVLAYTLGLRHALDADHIAAIDLMTRKLIASGQRPVTVGMYFSLGHSTIVVITSVAVAGTAASFSSRFDHFSRVGGIVGTSVSASFLIILGAINAYILYKLVKQMNVLIYARGEVVLLGEGIAGNWQIQGAGCLVRVFRGVFKIVDRPWKMYPLGILFGLGFDTSSEVALLGIASIQAAKGTSIWLILIFPVVFTAGMCLLDTTDGALMSTLYTTSSFTHDDVAITYYSIVLTTITVIVAIVIGVIQVLSLIQNVLEPDGRFWDGVERAGEKYDVIGGCIAGLFVLSGVAAYALYAPFRSIVDRRRSEIECAASREDLTTTAAAAAAADIDTSRGYGSEGEAGVVGVQGTDQGKDRGSLAVAKVGGNGENS